MESIRSGQVTATDSGSKGGVSLQSLLQLQVPSAQSGSGSEIRLRRSHAGGVRSQQHSPATAEVSGHGGGVGSYPIMETGNVGFQAAEPGRDRASRSR